MADSESDRVLRTYRVGKGRVVEVGKLTVMAGNEAGPQAWTTPAIVA